MSDNRYIKAVASAAVPVGAKLMKTGQTTSFATADDGATQRGRLTNFTTLASNNPFGTTSRFTNKSGGTTYPSIKVTYDWSTYDGSTVLAYYFGDTTTRAWATQLTQHTGSTIDGLTGWYLANFYEMNNILNSSLWQNFMLNYAPFSSSLRYYWISTNPTGTQGVCTDLAAVGVYISIAKTSALYGMWVRVCTVSGTTIT